MRISSSLARRSLFVVTILILLCAVLIGPTNAVSGLVGKSVKDLLASVGVNDTPAGEPVPHLDGIDVSNGPQFDISSVLNFQNAGAPGPAIQGDGGQGTTPGSNGNGSQSNNNTSNNFTGNNGGSFGPRGFAPGHGGSLGSGGSGGGGGAGGVGPANLNSEETSNQNDQGEDQDDQSGPSSGPQGAVNPSNPGGQGNSDGPAGPPASPGNGGSSPDNSFAGGPGGGNGPTSPTIPDGVTGPDSKPGTGNGPFTSQLPQTNTLQPNEENLDAVPEPSSLVLLAFGVYAAARRRSRTGNN
jgi:hypothetical protein